MWKKLVVHKRMKMSRPVLLVSVSTFLPQYKALYSQARELANHLIRTLRFEQIATLYASALSPSLVIQRDGTSRLIADHFYHYSGERDIVLFAGDGAPAYEQYEFANEILRFAKGLGVNEFYSVGARWSESLLPPQEVPKVLGFATDASGVEELKSSRVEIVKDEAATFFSNLIVGLGGLDGMRGYKISVNHGEPIPHAKSLIQISGVLSRMLHLSIDTGELERLATQVPTTIRQTGPKSEARGEGQSIYH